MTAGSASLVLAQAIRRALRNSQRHWPLLGGLSLGLASMPGAVVAAELPVACVAGSCGSVAGFVGAGTATAAVAGNTLTVNQATQNVALNWQSFNVGRDGVVNFVQPDGNSVALNRIFQGGASVIAGTLTANGRVYLINQNGVVFGEGANVNVAGLIATSLDMTPAALANGIANAVQAGEPAFRAFDNGNPTGDVTVQAGASISTAEGGQVMMFAPNVSNQGVIRTPGGQTLLAAGAPVYLATSADDNLRGMLVEVGTGGTLTNGNSAQNAGIDDPARMIGQIIAERGNVTLAGLAVNQEGRITATTTVKENGSIRLQARDGGSASTVTLLNTGNDGGTLTLGARSVTEAALAADLAETAVDSTEQRPSAIRLQGGQIRILEQARVSAPGGTIIASARANPSIGVIDGTATDSSRIYVAPGALLDVAGANVELAMDRNVVRAELRGNELANSPEQRDGVLRGEAVFVDIRESGTRADGSAWQGTPLADVSGQISLIERTVAERSLRGGTITLEAQGSVMLAAGSTLDVSGGSITYESGYINTTQIVGADGKVYDIADADPARVYTAMTSGASYTVSSQRWGVTQTYSVPGGVGRFEGSYVEGKDAGTLQVVTPFAVLDGEVLASVEIGRYQRALATALANGQIYRAFDQLPQAAELVLGRAPAGSGNDQVGGDMTIADSLILTALRNADGSLFDPQRDALPEGLATTVLRPDWFGGGGFGRADIHSNGVFELPLGVQLQLPGQGEFAVQARELQIGGQIAAPSGVIALEAMQTATAGGEIQVTLAASAVLDTGGVWVNDSILLNAPGAQPAPLWIDGGDVELDADGGSLLLAPGALIDVSAGARALADGSVVAGGAGSIRLNANADLDQLAREPVRLGLGAELRGYGLENGGALAISAPEICVAQEGLCGSGLEGTLQLPVMTLLAGGFANLSLESNERGLRVEPGTRIDIEQRNQMLTADALGTASGAAISEVTDLVLLPDPLRGPTHISLRADIADLPGSLPYTNADFSSAPGLQVGTGAVLNADAGSSITLRSNSVLVVDGRLAAPSGEIALTLDNGLLIGEAIDAQGIWLDGNASLDVSGTARLIPDPLGLRQGEVLAGGTVTLIAQRGAVVTNPGSMIDVGGTTATLDIGAIPGSVVSTTPTVIASNAGEISITAADAIVLNGQISAHQGGSPSAMGGRLSLTLDANSRRGDTALLLPVEQRQLVVAASSAPVAVAPGSVLPDGLARSGQVDAAAVVAAGFDSLMLRVRTTEGLNEFGTETIRAPGVIEFAGEVGLSLDHEIVLDAARVTGSGNVSLTAPRLQLGHQDAARQDNVAPVDAVQGSLRVAGAFVEVLGRTTIDGFSDVSLESTGDLRLRGVRSVGTAINGSLATSADLRLRADQVYASTLTDFSVSAGDPAGGLLRIETTGESRAAVLSAGSQLHFAAATIEQAGVVRAPFGVIEMQADDLRLEAGSLTSTSAEDLVIPFGSIQAGSDWVYGLGGQTLVVGDTTPVPEQTVSLNGDRVAIAAGATIDLSAGGDLLAYEFIPGTTGTRDVLSAAAGVERFAIVPRLALDQAPHDPQESTGTNPSGGDVVHLSAGIEGLPPGDYVLLPARYALLEGAYLVEPVAGFTDLPAGAALPGNDGSTIVSGYLRTAATPFTEARSSGFAIRAGSTVADEARYATALASDFFVAQGERAGTAPARLPQDAGVLAISAGTALDIAGQLRAAAAEAGRGAAVDISADNLVISDTAVAGVGEVVVSASALSALGAESLLLGGRRASADQGTLVDANSRTVTIDSGAALTAPELLLVATDTVVVEAAELTASGAVSRSDTYLAEGDGALLRLAAGEQAEVSRRNEVGAAGTLRIEAGARLTAPGGALALDASLDTQSAGTLALESGSLSLGASHVNLGNAPAGAAGLTLDAVQLRDLDLEELVLVSRTALDVFGDISLDVRDLVIDAAGVRGQAGSEAVAIAAARSILLTNRDGRTDADTVDSQGVLRINADEISVGEGVQRVSGFAAVELNAASRISGTESGGLEVLGALQVNAPVLLAETAADTALTASGDLQVAQLAGGAAAESGQSGLGGRLALTGASVGIATRIEAAAGAVSITATDGDLTLAANAIIDVAGRAQTFDGIAVAAPAGDINLRAAVGSVSTQAGSLLDVAAIEDGKAGSVVISAAAGAVMLEGAIDGAANDARDSGRIAIDTAAVQTLSSLNRVLSGGGIQASASIRQRGAGDLVLEGGDTLTAGQLALTADQGNVIVDGTIDARSAKGGSVILSAGAGIEIKGSILAQAGAADGADSSLQLHADAGGVLVNSGATIDLSAGPSAQTAGGELQIRVRREVAESVTDLDPANDGVLLGGTLTGIGRTSLEAFRRYSDLDLGLVDGVITDAQTVAAPGNVLFDDASAFMAVAAPAIATALGRAGDTGFRVLPGIEIQSGGALSLGADASVPTAWDLSQWRFGGVPGVLTLRAGQALTFNGSLSDGFTGVAGTTANAAAFRLTATTDSWSYRLVAGADTASAAVLAVTANPDADFTIAGGAAPSNATNPGSYQMVRTGSGSIDVAVGGDFILGNQQSVLYTAGLASTTGISPGNSAQGLGGRLYPEQGGDITLSVVGDIEGAQTNQLVTDWLWRSGVSAEENPTGLATAWTVNFGRFQQNVAALGGGNLEITAGGHIRNFSASVPSIGRQIGSNQAGGSRVEVIGGGDLVVRAGGNIEGGSYFVGLGDGELRSGGDITSSPYVGQDFNEYRLNPILALGDGQWQALARGAVGIEAVVNPTLLPQGGSQFTNEASRSWFSTYTQESAVELLAVSGDAALSNDATGLVSVLSTSRLTGDNEYLLQLYAPSLDVVSMVGDVLLSGKTTLFPGADTTLSLLAEGNVRRGDPLRTVVFRQLDADPAYLPSIEAPRSDEVRLAEVINGVTSSGLASTNVHALVPVHASDGSVARVVARTGDVTLEQSGFDAETGMAFSMPTRIVAGGDIVDLSVNIQHDGAGDTSSISAGGDIRYTVARNESGVILTNSREVVIDGPGTLLVAAGRDIDLQTSGGISSRGNLSNPQLADTGASINVLAGAADNELGYAAMVERYLAASADYQAELTYHVRRITGTFPASPDEALGLFRSFSVSEQRPLLEYILLAELRASAIAAAAADPATNGNYSRGFAVLDTMFPDGNQEAIRNATSRYKGDIALYFSRIYTQDGGDITLLAPGGGVNAGLAAPPSSFGIEKSADQLGIVTQRGGDVGIVADQDLLVNESRVFAIDDSDILVWSSSGDIDAGRGAKTAISAPAAVITYDRDGFFGVTYSAALAGSGIQARVTTSDGTAGDVVLAAPRGVVNAGDAGIVAGNLTIAATAVLGADNIQVSGAAVGVPVDTGGLGASLAGVSAAAGSASNAAGAAVSGGEAPQPEATPLANSALSWLEVFVVGLGEDTCKPEDVECLKRQSE